MDFVAGVLAAEAVAEEAPAVDEDAADGEVEPPEATIFVGILFFSCTVSSEKWGGNGGGSGGEEKGRERRSCNLDVCFQSYSPERYEVDVQFSQHFRSHAVSNCDEKGARGRGIRLVSTQEILEYFRK